MNLTKMESDRLREHMLGTYHSLRFGMGMITAAIPLAVYLAGLFSGVGLQGSLSAYYWADKVEPNIPRTLFVGGLFAIAAFLYLYKGFTKAENYALNAAAFFGALVALVPKGEGTWDPGFFHGSFAVATFAFLAYVVWFRAPDTLEFLPPKDAEGPATKPFTRAWYLAQYRIISLVMLASPITAAILELSIGNPSGEESSYIFFIESAGIWAFAWYWFAKSSELKRSAAVIAAVDGKLWIKERGVLNQKRSAPPLKPLTNT